MYASLFAASQLWVMDEEIDFLKFGCLFVRSVPVPNFKMIFTLSQVNPEPDWIRKYQKDIFPENSIKAHSAGVLYDIGYFGRSNHGVPCAVSVSYKNCGTWHEGDNKCHSSGDILQATGHQLYRVKSGDPLPPNAVVVGLSDTEGFLYLGRVEGSYGSKVPCSVSTEDGKIKQFFYPTGDKTRFESACGEILVLTNDATT